MSAVAEREEEVDPTEFLRALLKISPEDAEEVRDNAAKLMEREDRKRVQEGPTADYGDEQIGPLATRAGGATPCVALNATWCASSAPAICA